MNASPPEENAVAARIEAMKADRVADVVVSYDCFPMIGGAHSWLYEVYRRWPTRVDLLTTEYTASEQERQLQEEFDSGEHGLLKIRRLARRIDGAGVSDPACLRAYIQHVGAIGRLARPTGIRVHALRAFPEGFAAMLYKQLHRRKTKLITYAHGEEILVAKTSRQLRWMAARVYAGSDVVVANSSSTRDLVLEVCPRASVVIVHPGVDAASFRVPKEEADARCGNFGWPQDTLVVATVARMEARKNQATLIRAVAQLRAEGLSVVYVCAGDGPERPKLVELADELGIAECVLFPGRVSEQKKRIILAACDVHAMVSIQVGPMVEGFGIVFLEAAAAGVPSIAGNNGGQSEAVLDGRTGFVVDGERLDEVCQALSTLLRDGDLRRRMGREGLGWAARHDWSVMAHNARIAIESALSRRGRS